MNNGRMAILASLLPIFSSVAGCLEDEAVEEIEDLIEEELDDSMNENNTAVENGTTLDNGTAEVQILGDVLVSTYHIEQLVSAVGGEHLNVQMLIPENVPLHDFEPTVADYVAFMDADLFFYHGLNLEPRVDVTMDALGNNAPTAIQTHAMPSGEVSLDYGSILIEDLCETMSEGPYEPVILADEESHAGEVEIHAERVAHSLTIPESDEEDHDDQDDYDVYSSHPEL